MGLELTSFGQTRHDQILELALRQARRQRRRRQMFRAGFICLALLVIGVAVFHRPRAPLDLPLASNANESLPRALSPVGHPGAVKITIERIETDPTIAHRLAVPTAKPKWEQIDDDQLSQELAKAGHPAGLANIGGKVILIFHTRSL